MFAQDVNMQQLAFASHNLVFVPIAHAALDGQLDRSPGVH